MGSYLRNHPELQDDPGEPEVYVPTQDDWADFAAWCDRMDAEQALEQADELDTLERRTAGVLQ